MENQTETTEKQLNIDDVLDDFIRVNQEVFNKLATLKMTLESVAITLVPIERRMVVMIKEYAGNALKPYRKGASLGMPDIDFDEHINKYIAIDTRMRMADFQNLDANTIGEILDNNTPQEIQDEQATGMGHSECDEESPNA